VSIQFGPEWRQFDQRLQQMPQALERDVRRTLTSSLVAIERDAKREAPQDTRRLAGSITHQITGAFPALVGEVGPGVRYGIVMERGRRVGAKMPPVAALIPWVRRHWNPAFVGPLQTGQLRPRRAAGRNVTASQLRSRAFVLARAIQRRGIDPHPFMRPAWDRNRGEIIQAFERVGARVVARLAGDALP
jgi:Bacteriophage HK97-gp10, putative tail-component